MRERVKLHSPDVWLIVSVVVLVLVGLLLVFDASYAKAADSRTMNNDPWFLARKQIIFALLGFLCLYLASRFSYARLKWLTKPILVVAVLGLVWVLISGREMNGALSYGKIWFLYFQPSEFAKIGMILYLAWVLSPARTFAEGRAKRWVIPAAVCVLMIGLVAAEKDLGTAVLMAGAALCTFFAAGARKRYLALTVVVIGVIAVGLFTCVPHVMARKRAFEDPWKYRFGEGYQTVHALAGIATAGPAGLGPCEGRVKFYIPAASTDYIFVTLVEEMGLAGGLGLMLALGVFAYRGLHIAHRAKSTYGSILATGMVSLVSVQAAINLAVVTHTIPTTGLSLPFISYGGSGMLAMLTCAGIIIAVSRQVDVKGDRLESEESGSGRRRHGRTRISGNQRGAGTSRSGPADRVTVRR